MNYYASRDPFADTPATQSQNRQLLNWGVEADVATTQGHNSIKYGVDLKQTQLLENFGFGITDPGFNSPCIDSTGSAIGDPTLTNPGQCVGAGFEPNTADNPDVTGAPFSTALLKYDLTRGGSLFAFHGTQNINQYAFYARMKSVGATSSSTLDSALIVTTASCRKRDRSRAPVSLTT